MKLVTRAIASRIYPLLTPYEKSCLDDLDFQMQLFDHNQPCAWNGVGWDGDRGNAYGRACVREALYNGEWEIFEPYMTAAERNGMEDEI